MSLTRREALTMAAGSAVLVAAAKGEAMAQKKKAAGSPAPIAAGQHPIVPLPFDPKKLTGISEKMIVSHHENNYSGAVKNLNKVELELVQFTKDTPGFAVAGLKERELLYTNSMILHEQYFANLGGDGKASGEIEKALTAAAGTFARWEELFRAAAMSLGGGSGWVILDFNFHSGDLRTYSAGNHTQAVAFGQPLLVLDMYEHSYAMDHGASHAKYIDAFFQNVRWSEVNRRLERARKAAKVFAA